MAEFSGSSKQPQPERLRDWYPYYAGFPSTFVRRTLDNHLPAVQSILDPWNGSGTTTALAAGRGVRFMGLDINPASAVIARARLTPSTIGDSLDAIAVEVVTASGRVQHAPVTDDPLRQWFREPAVIGIRGLQRAINEVVVGYPGLEQELSEKPAKTVDSLPMLGAFYYAALFAGVRDLLQSFRGTNPSWLRFPATPQRRINPSVDSIAARFLERSSYLAERLPVSDEAATRGGSVCVRSVLELDDVDAFDGCVTSPPYATRVDYVRSLLAELSVLGLSRNQLDQLRLATTGSPRVKGRRLDQRRFKSPLANANARAVSEHASHGSANYYGPWISAYFADLDSSLTRIERAVTPTGRIALVVQDSYYKQLHIDLQTIVIETMDSLGRSLVVREDYPVRHLFSRINPAARMHLSSRSNQESLLVFA